MKITILLISSLIVFVSGLNHIYTKVQFSYKDIITGAPKAQFDWNKDQIGDLVNKGMGQAEDYYNTGMDQVNHRLQNAVNNLNQYVDSSQSQDFRSRIANDIREISNDIKERSQRTKEAISRVREEIEEATDHFWGGRCLMDSQSQWPRPE